jgi:arsenate reductase
MAEALFNARSGGTIAASSAGSRPAPRVNPYAIRALKEIGIDWAGHEPRSVDEYIAERFDLVITVCDNAKEACPIFPGAPAMLHWGMDDPAEVEGSDQEKALAFASARDRLAERIDDYLKKKNLTAGLRG